LSGTKKCQTLSLAYRWIRTDNTQKIQGNLIGFVPQQMGDLKNVSIVIG